MRFLSLSPLSQISTSLLLIGFLGWLGVSTARFISVDGELEKRERELEASREAFSELNEDMARLESELQDTVAEVRAKQKYLEALIRPDSPRPAALLENIPRIPENTETSAEQATDDAAVEEESFLRDDTDTDDTNTGFSNVGGPFTGVSEWELTIGNLTPITQIPSPVPWQPLRRWWDEIAGTDEVRSSGLSRSVRLHSIEKAIAQIETEQLNFTQELINHFTGQIAHIGESFAIAGLEIDAVVDALDDTPQNAGGPFEALPSEERNLLEDAGVLFRTLLEKQESLADLKQAVASFPVVKPLRDYHYISSSFGRRRDPFNKARAMHSGLDLASHWKTPVYATAPGVVVKAGWNGAYGRMIEIDHGNGFKTRYGHLKTILVERGQQTAKGERIGLMGNSGRSTGTHLHYEIRFLDTPYNPVNFFKAEQHVLKLDDY